MTDTGDLIETEIERTITEVLPKAHEKHRRGRLSALRWCLSILPPDAPSPDRERVARIIEPMPWLREARGLQAHQLDAATKHASLVKADAILALTAADPIPIERERFVLPYPAPGGLEAQITAAIAGLQPLTGYGEDNVWRPADRAWQALCNAAAALFSAAPVLSEPQWRDIASAPKDGTAILAWTIYGPQVLSWGTGRYNRSARRYDSGWSSGPNVYEPELWQPLPAPPAKPSEGTK